MVGQEVYILAVESQWNGESSLDLTVYEDIERVKIAFLASVKEEYDSGALDGVEAEDIYDEKVKGSNPEAKFTIESSKPDDLLPHWCVYKTGHHQVAHVHITIYQREIQ
jgi:hypothetical protein